MNLNVKLEAEEEQTLQYVNRYAINIPPGATTFNLNIVNPGLSNQSYILNPVNPVGQNIVAYQQPMAVQSYIALPTEPEGNILHSLPVGVPVPVGLPVPTSLIQNPNFVNTSIIIGNEDCNAPGVVKSSHTNINPENEIKINYIEKPSADIINNTTLNSMELPNLGFNGSPQINSETLNKKICPLEMSIKAANIDMEFEKCDAEVPILLDKTPQIKTLLSIMPLEDKSSNINSKVPSEILSLKTLNDEKENELAQLKTEITWEGSNIKNEVANEEFQESLICEVEEVNDDEEEEEDEDLQAERGGENGNVALNKTQGNSQKEVNHDEGFSSEESDTLPLSVALKLRNSSEKSNKNSPNKRNIKEDTRVRKKSQRNKKKVEVTHEDEQWSESDDDVLNLKRIKNEFNYKCFYEPGKTKSATSLVLKLDDKSQKFVRVRSCCSKKECGKKISVKDQKTAFKNFYDLDSNVKRDAYLINCIEQVQKHRSLEKENTKDKSNLNDANPCKPEEKKLLVNANIQLEIENESNGNQKLSDEIQNAIKESLKDCIERNETNGNDIDGNDKCEKNSWNFYIVIDRCRKKVCLQFLLKLFRITKNRIKQLQKKILSGMPLTEESVKTNQKQLETWEVARLHLDSLPREECLDCSAYPKHRYLLNNRSKEDLFESFKEYYTHRVGKEPNIKYNSYKRFLDKESTVLFMPNKGATCMECEEAKKQGKKKKPVKSVKGKKKAVTTDSEEASSDDEPLLKRKKLKLTIPLKSNDKTQQNASKRNCKSNSVEKKSKGRNSKEKSRQSTTKGRDVWSLMLLHLETMPYKECKGCVSKKKHRFLNPSLTTQALFEDYRKYFLKETNSELGLGFTMYEKYFMRNCNYTISDVDVNASVCPRCAMDQTHQKL